MGNKKEVDLPVLQNFQVNLDAFECSMTTDIGIFDYLENRSKLFLIKRSVGEFTDD